MFQSCDSFFISLVFCFCLVFKRTGMSLLKDRDALLNFVTRRSAIITFLNIIGIGYYGCQKSVRWWKPLHCICTRYVSITVWNCFPPSRRISLHEPQAMEGVYVTTENPALVSCYIWLAYIFEASYSTVVKSARKKTSVEQSELEK